MIPTQALEAADCKTNFINLMNSGNDNLYNYSCKLKCDKFYINTVILTRYDLYHHSYVVVIDIQYGDCSMEFKQLEMLNGTLKQG